MADQATLTRTRIVQTSAGPVRGVLEGKINAFKGVRYGAAPVGALRFKPPQKPAPWRETFDAVSYGAASMQAASTAERNKNIAGLGPALAPIVALPEDASAASEDCLFLNIWTQGLGDGAKRPVMVWMHGGGYTVGSGSWPVYEGKRLAEIGDVVVVTLNHRLNVFGYLYLRELMGEDYAASGNVGQLDMVLALGWVRDNIAAFGGDPANVTIFGESGGGMKVTNLLATPAAQGLFHKAIVQSGPALRAGSTRAATATARAVLDELKITPGDTKALSDVPATDILNAMAALARPQGEGEQRRGPVGPVVDGVTLPDHPFDPGAPATAASVPIMVGFTKDEGTFFNISDPKFGALTDEDVRTRITRAVGDKADAMIDALRAAYPDYSPTHRLCAFTTLNGMGIGSIKVAERKAAQGATAVYAYVLNWETPVCNGLLRSTHALDLPLMFNTVESARDFVGPGEAPQRVADQMSAAWIAFARTGNPNTPSLPLWTAYNEGSRATMLFDVESRVENDPNDALRALLAG